MQFRPAEVFPLLGIATGLIVSQVVGLEGPTTAFFSLFAVLAAGYYAGPRLVQSGSMIATAAWGSLSALAVLMLLRGGWFYLGQPLGGWGDVWTTIVMLAIALGFIVTIETPLVNDAGQDDLRSIPIVELIVLIASIAGFVAIAYAAMHNATTATIRTPWPLMPWWTLPVIGMLWALALAAAWRLRRSSVTFVQIACAFGALTVIAPLLYVIGYGFDGFLHVAGETVLAKTGLLTPKPPYYMGQYVFVTWFAQLFALDVGVVDRWLVPVAAALLIPGAAYLSARRSVTIMLALVLIPLGAFVATTPHGFATVLGVVALLTMTGAGAEAIRGDAERRPYMGGLFSMWATLTHPLVGLPILCAIAATIVWRGWARWALGIPLAILAGVSVPLVFGLASGLGSAAGVNFDLGKVMNASSWSGMLTGFIPWVPNRYALWPQAAEWVVKLLPWVTLVFAFLGLTANGLQLTARGRDAVSRKPLAVPWIISAISTFTAALVLKMAGDFGFLIDYERGNYADRLFMVAWLLLLPVAIPELGRRLENAARAPFINKLAVLTAIGFLGAGSSYAALPRHDAVTPSRGFSVGAADIEAVKLIDQDSVGEPYTVLANQSISAAAVKTFGFKRYNHDVFFYPIPTGGPLYDVFLRASYEDASRETMKDAARLGGSNLVYFVVNDYWWDAGQLGERAASSTDREFVIRDGKVRVFKYELK